MPAECLTKQMQKQQVELVIQTLKDAFKIRFCNAAVTMLVDEQEHLLDLRGLKRETIPDGSQRGRISSLSSWQKKS